ncbi:TPA: FAD-dependent oxidoreductase [Citrobacter freundii]
MSDAQFDAIIVGAGISGCIAAFVMAKAGLDVLVIERGDTAGSKNMTGGRLYTHSLEEIIPGFTDTAPLEREVIREKISFLTAESAVTLDYHSVSSQHTPSASSWTVLRHSFDSWLMEQAEEAGAQFITGVRVDSLLRQEGRVTGVQAGEDTLEASVVVLADGVNSLLGRSVGMVKASSPHHYAVGVKELIALSATQIQERFGVTGNEGAAWLFAGSPSDGLMGGGFLYTNRDTLSLGVVCGLGDIEHAHKTVPQMLEDFKQHPTVRPLIEGGKLLEYSAHLVPEGGIDMVPTLVGDGVVMVGDAAGMCLNLGYTVRGMDLAVTAANIAAQTIIAAKSKNDFSQKTLQAYPDELEKSAVLRDMRHYRRLPAMMENPRIFQQYPQMAADIMASLFSINGKAPVPLWSTMLNHGRKIGLMNLLKDGIRGVRAL